MNCVINQRLRLSKRLAKTKISLGIRHLGMTRPILSSLGEHDISLGLLCS